MTVYRYKISKRKKKKNKVFFLHIGGISRRKGPNILLLENNLEIIIVYSLTGTTVRI